MERISFFFFINDSLGLHLPSFINEINHQGAEDEENEQGNEHVVDSPDVVHLKQLTGANTSRRRLDFWCLKTSIQTQNFVRGTSNNCSFRSASRLTPGGTCDWQTACLGREEVENACTKKTSVIFAREKKKKRKKNPSRKELNGSTWVCSSPCLTEVVRRPRVEGRAPEWPTPRSDCPQSH